MNDPHPTATAPTQSAWLAAMPALFVFLWSTGFIGAKFGLPYAEPMTFLALRFGIVSALMLVVAVIWRAPWPRRLLDYAHLAIVGLLLHGLYLGGVFASIGLGVEAGVSALIVSIQPLLVAALAAPLLRERVTPRQWLGLGLGLAGVLLVVWRKLALGMGSPAGMSLSLLALLGITLATLYQKRFCANMDLRSGSVVQYAAASLGTGTFAFAFESREIVWSGEFVFALVWLVLVLSLGAVSLLILMIRKGAVARVSSLFFLVPPSTALIAWPLFGETLGPLALAGMLLACIGVGLVNR